MANPTADFTWQIVPSHGARTGVSLFVMATTKAELTPDDTRLTAWLSPVARPGAHHAEEIELKLGPGEPGQWLREFTVMLGGDYQVRIGNEVKLMHVDDQEYLNFGSEFGLFSGAVTLLVGGMLIWLSRSKRKPRANVDGPI